MTPRRFLPALLTLFLVPAAPASAADFCVADPACVAAGGTPVGSNSAAVQDALDLAADTPDADRVLIGPGEFDAAGDGGYHYWASSALELAGAGAGKTILTLSAPQSDAFTLDFEVLSGNGRLRDIGLLLGPGYGGNAVALAGVVAERIAVTSGPATDANQGVRFLSDAVLRDSTIDVRGENPVGLVIGSLVEGDYLAERVTIHSDGRGVMSGPQPGSNGALSQVRVDAAGRALSVERSSLRAASSLFRGSEPVRVTADLADTTFVADHVTLATSAPTGLEVLGESGDTAAAVLRNSIVTGPGRAFSRIGDGGTARITTDHVAHAPVAAGDESGSGELVLQHSLPAPAAFADAAYRLRADSPLVDAGTAPTIDEPAGDLDGRARVADGNGDCKAASDVGAYERPAPKPCGGTVAPPPPVVQAPAGSDTTAPVVSGLQVRRRGTRLELRLSEAAMIRVRVQKRKAGRWRTVKAVRRAAPAGGVKVKLPRRGAGRRRVAVVAVDAAGNRSATARKRYRLAAAAH